MKKILSLPALLIFILFSCHKDASLPVNTIMADIDGVKETFNVNAQAGYSLGFPYDAYITGYNTPGPEGEMLQIALRHPNRHSFSGQYPFGPTTSNTPVCSITLQVKPGDAYTPDDSQPGATLVTVTFSTFTNIQGTFSGKLVDANNRTHTVTNGKFNVNFK